MGALLIQPPQPIKGKCERVMLFLLPISDGTSKFLLNAKIPYTRCAVCKCECDKNLESLQTHCATSIGPNANVNVNANVENGSMTANAIELTADF